MRLQNKDYEYFITHLSARKIFNLDPSIEWAFDDDAASFELKHLRDMTEKLVEKGQERINPIKFLLTEMLQYYWDDLHIIALFISSGLYSQTIRELRFLLESFAQGYYLDKFYPSKTLHEKIMLLNKESLYGYKLFEKAFRKQKMIISQFNTAYKELSDFVHSSTQELRKFIYPNTRRIFSGAASIAEMSVLDFVNLLDELGVSRG